MINDKIDYVVIYEDDITTQKLLNTWIHTYNEIQIIKCKIFDNGKIKTIIKRIK